MSSWGTNPWSDFCNPQWELIGHNKSHLGTSETSKNSRRDTVLCVNMALKLPQYFCLLVEKPLFPSLISILSRGTVQPENTYSCIVKVTRQVWESQKRVSINNHGCIRIHLPKPISTVLYNYYYVRFLFLLISYMTPIMDIRVSKLWNKWI